MNFTYSKYALPYPFLAGDSVPDDLRAAVIFLPDQILDGLRQDVVPHVTVSNALRSDGRVYIAGPVFTPQETHLVTMATLAAVDPRLCDSFSPAWREKRIAMVEKPKGFSQGRCTPVVAGDDKVLPLIEFGYDYSISDAAYMLHEAGHFIAQAASAGFDFDLHKNNRTMRCAQEVQAFFLQHAFYDTARCVQDMPALTEVICQHCRAETESVLRGASIESSLLRIQALQASPADDCATEAGFGQIDAAYAALYDGMEHMPAYFLAAGLYDRFNAWDQDRRTAFVDTLYFAGNGGAPLSLLLQQAGIETETDLSVLLRAAADQLTDRPSGMVIRRAAMPAPSIRIS